MRNIAKGAGLFVLFYGVAWTVWFAVFTAGEFVHYFDYLELSWTADAWGLPLLIQVFALGTAIFSTWILHALNELGWF